MSDNEDDLLDFGEFQDMTFDLSNYTSQSDIDKAFPLARDKQDNTPQKVIQRSAKAKEIYDEIVSTEVSYNETLRLVNDFFYEPLWHSLKNDPKPILAHSPLTLIFGHIPALLENSTDLLMMLKKEKMSIGEAFGKLTPRFKQTFSDYSSNFHMATSLLSEALDAKASTFREFTKKAEKQPGFGMHNISSLLLNPVQRPPRYKMLLEQLDKEISEEDRDSKILKSSLEAMKKCVSEINEQIRQLETIVEVLDTLIVGSKAPLLLHPDRHLVRKGVLKKMCNREKKTRMVYLFNDMLLYARPRSGDTWEYAAHILLHTITIHPSLKDDKQLTMQIASKALIFFFRSKAESLEWKADLDEYVNNAKRKQSIKGNKSFIDEDPNPERRCSTTSNVSTLSSLSRHGSERDSVMKVLARNLFQKEVNSSLSSSSANEISSFDTASAESFSSFENQSANNDYPIPNIISTGENNSGPESESQDSIASSTGSPGHTRNNSVSRSGRPSFSKIKSASVLTKRYSLNSDVGSPPQHRLSMYGDMSSLSNNANDTTTMNSDDCNNGDHGNGDVTRNGDIDNNNNNNNSNSNSNSNSNNDNNSNHVNNNLRSLKRHSRSQSSSPVSNSPLSAPSSLSSSPLNLPRHRIPSPNSIAAFLPPKIDEDDPQPVFGSCHQKDSSHNSNHETKDVSGGPTADINNNNDANVNSDVDNDILINDNDKNSDIKIDYDNNNNHIINNSNNNNFNNDNSNSNSNDNNNSSENESGTPTKDDQNNDVSNNLINNNGTAIRNSNSNDNCESDTSLPLETTTQSLSNEVKGRKKKSDKKRPSSKLFF